MEKTRFSHRLQLLRERKGLTQAQVAAYLGCSQQSVSSWESGELEPSLSNIQKLTEFYKISINYLIPDALILESEQVYSTKEDLFETFFTSKNFLDYYPKLNFTQALKLSKLIQAHVDFLEENITSDEP